MRLKFKVYPVFFVLLFYSSCTIKTEEVNTAVTLYPKSKTIKYAKYFDIETKEGFRIVRVFGKRNSKDTTAVFILFDSIKPKVDFGPNAKFLQVPCTSIVALSSIYSAMLKELNALSILKGIDNIDYAIDSSVINKWKQGNIIELAKGPEPDLEQLIQLQPDMVFMFGMGKPEEETHPKLKKSDLTFALIIDHLEETPLARAEWIKLISAFVGKSKMADSLFLTSEKRYTHLKDSVSKIKNRPSVFTELKYGETWFVPGGTSFIANLINDASANYIWRDDKSNGSLALSFEQVYHRAHLADFWINLALVQNKKQMLSMESRYKNFQAYQRGALYNNNKRVNAKGYSDYWETAMFHPERVLNDLILIFHGNEMQQKELYYYRKIN